MVAYQKNNCNAVTVTLRALIFHLKSSISIRYNIYNVSALVIRTCKSDKITLFFPLKGLKKRA